MKIESLKISFGLIVKEKISSMEDFEKTSKLKVYNKLTFFILYIEIIFN